MTTRNKLKMNGNHFSQTAQSLHINCDYIRPWERAN